MVTSAHRLMLPSKFIIIASFMPFALYTWSIGHNPEASRFTVLNTRTPIASQQHQTHCTKSPCTGRDPEASTDALVYLDLLGAHSQMLDLFLEDTGDTFNKYVLCSWLVAQIQGGVRQNVLLQGIVHVCAACALCARFGGMLDLSLTKHSLPLNTFQSAYYFAAPLLSLDINDCMSNIIRGMSSLDIY